MRWRSRAWRSSGGSFVARSGGKDIQTFRLSRLLARYLVRRGGKAYRDKLAAIANGNTMSDITAALGDATTLFGVVVTLAVLVTGFFVGRRWFKRV